jgi:hypothetical protein
MVPSLARSFALPVALVVLALAAGCTSPSPSEASSESNVTGGQESEPGALEARIEELATQWGDENIMQGRANVQAVDLGPDGAGEVAALVQVAKDVLTEGAAYDEMVLESKIEETIEPLNDEAIALAGRTAAIDGFVYSDNADNVDPKVEEVRSIVALLGDAKDVTAVTLRTSGTIPSTESSDPYRVSTFLFVNKETGKGVAFFVREGWI